MNDMTAAPSFWVREIPIFGDLILAPMDGLSDYPFRSLVHSLGSAMSYTEFINAIDVNNKHPHLESRLTFSEDERPLVYQLFDNDPDSLLKAALKLQTRRPDIIDINMGCPDKSVCGRGAGVGLMSTPAKIAEIFSKLSKALDIPLTGKIRLGWDADNRNYLEVARVIEENGGQLLAVHGRTRQQAYSGQADWDAIAEVKSALSIPVIGNGDVRTVADIGRIKAHTGCDGVMIGRAAFANPWIFQRMDRHEVTPDTLRELVEVQLRSSIDFYGPSHGLVIIRKYVNRYLQPYELTREVRVPLLTCEDPNLFLHLLDNILKQPIPIPAPAF
jgi:tRNA-dihydrouridine synthase B